VKKQSKDRDKIEVEFREQLYDAVSVSLSERDNLVFSFMMVLSLAESEGMLERKLIDVFFSPSKMKF